MSQKFTRKTMFQKFTKILPQVLRFSRGKSWLVLLRLSKLELEEDLGDNYLNERETFLTKGKWGCRRSGVPQGYVPTPVMILV